MNFMVIKISLDCAESRRLVKGEKIKSGLVVLNKGESVGKHSTHENEEIIVVLEGEGVLVADAEIKLSKSAAVFVPKNIEHDVRNNGDCVLKYVYVVSSEKSS